MVRFILDLSRAGILAAGMSDRNPNGYIYLLLFAGFGGFFLFMSYFYRSWLHLPEHADS